MRIKTMIMDTLTGKPVKVSPWRKNLVLDQGLNALAADNSQALAANAAQSFGRCLVGDGTTPTMINSGAVTFTQSGVVVDSSSGFFTPAMVGSIFKYGSGTAGAEQYITIYQGPTQVHVAGVGMTVSTPTVATVWFVQQTALQNFLHSTSTYQTNPGDNSTGKSGNTVAYQRTFVFPVEAVQYTVNEIAWRTSDNNTNTKICGRIVLPSSDVVGTTNFYVVVMQLSVIYLPDAPTAVVNVGTNIDTAGDAMFEYWNIPLVNSNGSASSQFPYPAVGFIISSYTQNGSIQTSAPASVTQFGGFHAISYVAGSVGVMKMVYTGTHTTNGETLYGVCLKDNNGNSPTFDVKLTTPFTLPVGTFIPTIEFRQTFYRTLNNP